MKAQRIALPIAVLTLLVSALIGCDSAIAPTVEEVTTGGEADLPPIPEPASVSDDTPMASTTFTRIRPVTKNFRPTATDAKGHWVVRARHRCTLHVHDWVVLFDEADTWAHEIPTLTYIGQGGVFECAPVADAQPGNPFLFTTNWTPQMIENGVRKDEEQLLVRSKNNVHGSTIVEYVWLVTTPLTEDIYVRRDRRWVRAKIDNNTASLIIQGNISEAHTTSHSVGVSRTESETFGRALSVGGGLSWLSVSGTLDETYGSSVTTEEVTTTSIERTMSGKSNIKTVFNFWELKETYQIVNAAGEPYVTDNLVLDPMIMVGRGDVTALVATEFDAN